MDISNLSLVELKELERKIPKEIRRREVDERVKVRRELEALAQARGFSLNDVVAEARTGRVRSVSRGVVSIKYRHPQQADLAWSGRGRKPRWVEAWLANGGSLDQLAV
ncbi:MAG: H-NS histone family protein [Zoogloeaceae bacterium]|nr:H-NS histone family protein [Zoogloeaceae bacterium]